MADIRARRSLAVEVMGSGGAHVSVMSWIVSLLMP